MKLMIGNIKRKRRLRRRKNTDEIVKMMVRKGAEADLLVKRIRRIRRRRKNTNDAPIIMKAVALIHQLSQYRTVTTLQLVVEKDETVGVTRQRRGTAQTCRPPGRMSVARETRPTGIEDTLGRPRRVGTRRTGATHETVTDAATETMRDGVTEIEENVVTGTMKDVATEIV